MVNGEKIWTSYADFSELGFLVCRTKPGSTRRDGLSVLLRPDGSFQRLASLGLPLGIAAEGGWADQTVELAPGDSLVSFTDGLLDLYDGTLRAVDRVAELARGSASADDLVRRITALAATQANPDDVTVVVLRREA